MEKEPLTFGEALHIMKNDGVTLVSRPPYDWGEEILTAIWVHILGEMHRYVAAEPERHDKDFLCPACGRMFWDSENLAHNQKPERCDLCGQRLMWPDASGCFTGTLDDFLAKVTETHGDNKHAAAYRLAAELAKVRMGSLDADRTS
jgi:predicted RNA-binding Zn-ribbon protein involved in translation (DUF1610 family)